MKKPRKKRVDVPIDQLPAIESRLQDGESLHAIATSLGVTYQALQYQRSRHGYAKIRPSDVKGAAHPNWRGGVTIDKWGYRLMYAPHRQKAHPYTYEHVLVAEQKIGRRLQRNEHVHHLNGNKLDNSPNNLLVCTASEHRALHRQLESLAMDLVRRGEIVYRDGKYQFP